MEQVEGKADRDSKRLFHAAFIYFVVSTVLLLCAFTYAHAATVEVCGNGIDDPLATGGSANGTYGSCPAGYMNAVATGVGCDKKCPTPDEDHDGYATDATGRLGTEIDVDDTNRRVIPGKIYFCDPIGAETEGYRLAQTNGMWGTCVANVTTPLCEAAGGDSCYYLDPAGGGTTCSYASPCASLGMVAGGSPGSPPASAKTLGDGDFVYLMPGTFSTTYNDAEATNNIVHARFQSDGTLVKPITIKGYPGKLARPLISSTGTNTLKSFSGDFYRIESVDFTAGTVGNSESIVYLNGIDDWAFFDVYFRDTTGFVNNNFSGINAQHSNKVVVSHSYFKDIKWGSGSIDENSAAMLWLDDDATGEGADHWGHHNTAWWTVLNTNSANGNGSAFKKKHTHLCSDTGIHGHRIEDNSIVNPHICVTYHGSCLRYERNTCVCDPGGTCQIAYLNNDSARSLPMQDNRFYDNVFLNATSMVGRQEAWDGTESWTFRRNIVIDNVAVYNGEDAIFQLDNDGLDTHKAVAESSDFMQWDENCFYNANTAIDYAYFQRNNNATDDEGGLYLLAAFKTAAAAAGLGTNQYEENPSLNANLVAQSTNCLGKGNYLTASSPSVSTAVGMVHSHFRRFIR